MHSSTALAFLLAVLVVAGASAPEASEICEEGGECLVEADEAAQLQLHAKGKDDLLAATSKLVKTQGMPHAREAAGSVIYNGMLCLVGGRGTQPIDCFQANESKWIRYKAQTNDIHHVQPVLHNGMVWIVAGWTGIYPNDTDITDVLIWDPVRDKITTGCSIPRKFRTGAAGVVSYNGSFVIAAGASGGHERSHGAFSTPNMTVFDPASCGWSEIESKKPKFHRDHFQAVLLGTKMLLVGGRDSPFDMDPGKVPCYLTKQTEVFDLSLGENGTWVRVADMPAPRAGTSNVVLGSDVYVLGGEDNTTQAPRQCGSRNSFKWIARKEVHRYNVDADAWTRMPDMAVGRHAHGSAALPDEHGRLRLWSASGVACTGAAPMITSTERLR